MPTDAPTEPAATVSARQVSAFRLSRHRLSRRAPASDVARVAGDIAGVQAQLLSAARISLWARTRGLASDDVDAALWKDRTLAKVWCMRGTSHLVPSDDVFVFLRGCTRRVHRSVGWLAREGVRIDALEPFFEAVGRALDRPRTRKELAERLGRSSPSESLSVVEGGWGSTAAAAGIRVGGGTVSVGAILFLACMKGISCVGPDRGNEATFVRIDAWLPHARDVPVGTAETELLRRYLRAYGPATVADFAGWTYVLAADAREIWSRAERELARVDVEGRPGWILRSDLRTLTRSTLDAPVVRLLPSFDSYLLGHKDKGHLVDAAHYKRVYRAAGWLSPVVLVDGGVVGVWSHVRKGRRLEVRVAPFRRLAAPIREAVHEEAEDLGRFLGAAETRVRFT